MFFSDLSSCRWKGKGKSWPLLYLYWVLALKIDTCPKSKSIISSKHEWGRNRSGDKRIWLHLVHPCLPNHQVPWQLRFHCCHVEWNIRVSQWFQISLHHSVFQQHPLPVRLQSEQPRILSGKHHPSIARRRGVHSRHWEKRRRLLPPFPNKTTIRDVLGQEKCHSGFGEEIVEESEYKWMLNWVEIYEQLEGPFEGTLRYILPEEAPNERPDVEFVKPKFYLPADAWPAFELSMYKGA